MKLIGQLFLFLLFTTHYPFVFGQVKKNKSEKFHFNMSKSKKMGTSDVFRFDMEKPDYDYLKFYEAEMQEEMDMSDLFKPKGEFENQKMFLERQHKAEQKREQIHLKYQKKYKAHLAQQALALKRRIADSYQEVNLKIEELGRYEADKGEYFPILINGSWGKIYIPISEAESFKNNINRAKVTGAKQYKEDGQTMHIFNIKIYHPISRQGFPFGLQKEPLYLEESNLVRDREEEGVPELLASIKFVDPSGDQFLDASEEAKIIVTIRNNGKGSAQDIHMQVPKPEDPGIEVSRPLSISKLAPGDQAQMVLRLSANEQLTTGQITFDISFTEYWGYQPGGFKFKVPTKGLRPPDLVLGTVSIEEKQGDSDRIIENGEVIKVTLQLKNAGEAVAQNISTKVISEDRDIRLMTKDYPLENLISTIHQGEKQQIEFVFSINYRYEGSDDIPLSIQVQESTTGIFKTIPLGLKLKERQLATSTITIEGIADALVNAKNYALFFAVEEYDQFQDLENPINDAHEIANELQENFGFITEVIENPTIIDIERKLEEYSDKFAKNLDNKYHPTSQLLIYFSGHGQVHNRVGYFLPKDANAHAISRTAFPYPVWRNNIDAINCDHILVAIDACYSGTFDPNLTFKSVEDGRFQRPGELSTRNKKIQQHLKYTARRFLTSGSLDKTPDKSEFAKAILQGLRTHESGTGILSARELHSNYMGTIQTKPRIGNFNSDEAGSSFMFFKKQ